MELKEAEIKEWKIKNLTHKNRFFRENIVFLYAAVFQ